MNNRSVSYKIYSMLKIPVIIFFTFLSFNLSGQSAYDSTGIKLFDRGLEHYESGNMDSTLFYWKKVVDEKISVGYDTYGAAFFNIPLVYWEMNDYDKAKEWYLKILDSDLRDSDETGDLMEPHTNYKHKSAVALASLYYQDSNYTEVLEWLYKADTLYRYWGFEGSATNITKKQAYLLDWKTDVLLKLNRSNEAISAILTELICSRRLESFFERSTDALFNLIDEKTFKAEFDRAIEQIEIKMINENNWVASFSLMGFTCKIPISNTYPDTNEPHYWTIYFIDKNSVPDQQKIIEDIRKRKFYTRLTK